MTSFCSDQVGSFKLVEVGGVEPPSESTLTGLSPGADGYCGSLPPCSPPGRQAVTPSGQVRVIMRGRGNSYPPHGRHINDAFPGLWPLRFRRPPLVRQRQQLVCCCLIYKLPIFRMLGASARWSRLHTPVETGTPPRRRYKLRSARFRLRRKLTTLRLSLLFPPQTLRWLAAGTRSSAVSAVFDGLLRFHRITKGIVTHSGGGMCYNSMTFQIFWNFSAAQCV